MDMLCWCSLIKRTTTCYDTIADCRCKSLKNRRTSCEPQQQRCLCRTPARRRDPALHVLIQAAPFMPVVAIALMKRSKWRLRVASNRTTVTSQSNPRLRRNSSTLSGMSAGRFRLFYGTVGLVITGEAIV